MKKFRIPLIAIFLVMMAVGAYAATNKADWGDDVYINSTGILYAGQGISLGGVTKNSWGSVVSPWEDDGTTTTLTSAPTKFILTHSSGLNFATGLSVGTGDITFVEGGKIDGDTADTIKFIENSDTLSLVFDGTDIQIEASDGGIIFDLNQADGTVDFMTSNDDDDYIQISTVSNVPLINSVGSCDLDITASSGEITFDNENLTTSGTLDAGLITGTSFVIGDDTIDVVVDDQMRFASNDEESTIEAYGFEAKAAVLQLSADEGDDAGDKFQLVSTTSNTLTFTNDTGVKDTHAVILTLDKTGLLTTTGDIAVVNNTATTNAVVDVLSVEASSTGTAADGLGVGIVFRVEDETTSAEEQGSIDVVVTEAATGAENADFVLNLNSIGTIREVLRVDTEVSATTGTAFELTSWTIETNAVIDVLELTVDNTADTATDDFGLGISIVIEQEDSGTPVEQSSIDFVLTDAGTGAEDCDVIFSQVVGGTLAERVRFDADANNILLSGATPGITIGDDGAEDTNITFDGSVNEYYIALDDTGGLAEDALVIGLGTAVGTTPILGFNATQQMILENGELFDNVTDDTILFASNDADLIISLAGVTDKDVTVVLDGTAQDFYIGLDDTDDDLNIGLGTAPGTTPALEINEDLSVTISVSLKTPVGAEVGTNTLTINESGKLVVLNHATEFTTTLPAVSTASGVTYRFVLAVNPDTGVMDIKTDSGENKIYGVAIVNGAVIPAEQEDTITFTSSAALIGDWVELTSDGTNWYVSGQAAAATGIVFTGT